MQRGLVNSVFNSMQRSTTRGESDPKIIFEFDQQRISPAETPYALGLTGSAITKVGPSINSHYYRAPL